MFHFFLRRFLRRLDRFGDGLDRFQRYFFRFLGERLSFDRFFRNRLGLRRQFRRFQLDLVRRRCNRLGGLGQLRFKRLNLQGISRLRSRCRRLGFRFRFRVIRQRQRIQLDQQIILRMLFAIVLDLQLVQRLFFRRRGGDRLGADTLLVTDRRAKLQRLQLNLFGAGGGMLFAKNRMRFQIDGRELDLFGFGRLILNQLERLGAGRRGRGRKRWRHGLGRRALGSLGGASGASGRRRRGRGRGRLLRL